MSPVTPAEKLARILAKSKFAILDGIALADQELPTAIGDVSWHLVALEGAWKGHWQGPFRITSDTLQSMADHFDARKIPLVVDYEHQSLTMDRAPAAGWINELDLRTNDKGGKELWARTEWTERGAAYIRAKEYRYKSPTINWQTRDRVSGKVSGASLHSVALTNHPFLHELPEVTLNSMAGALALVEPETEQETMDETQIKELRKILGLADDADADAIADAVKALHISGKTLGEVFAALGDKVKDIAAAKAEILTLTTRSTAADGSAERIASMEATIKGFKDTEDKKTALELVRKYQAARKVGADGTDNFKACLKHAEADPVGFAAIMDTSEPWVAGGEQVAETHRREGTIGGTAPKTLADLNPAQLAAAQSAGLTDEDIEKHGAEFVN